MNKIIPIFGMMSQEIFFIIASIIGYKYSGIESSKTYVIYVIVVAILNLYLFVKYLFIGNSKIKYRELLIVFFPLIIFSFYIVTGNINNVFNPVAKTYFTYFLLWTVPVIYAGLYVNRANLLNGMVKYFEILMWVLTISVITTSIIPFVKGSHFISMGGASYQTASYLSAFAYGLNLYFIIFGKNHERFNFSKYRSYNWLCFMFLIIQLLGIFLSGGRGGIVLFAVYSLYMCLSVLKSKPPKEIVKFSFIVVAFIIITLIVLPNLLENDTFRGSFNRTIQFISLDSGVNWKGTSGRDIIYENTIDLIKQSPILGYGLYGFWDVSGYPHNIILEVLLNGGIIYLVFFIWVAIMFFKKLFLMIKFDEQKRVLLILLIYPLTMLMFSGTYMITTELWFVLAFVFSYNKMSRCEGTNQKQYIYN